MAFSWVGLKNYVDWADAKQAEEIKKQDEREALAFSLASKYGVDFMNDGASTTLAGASGTKAGLNQVSKTGYGLALKTLQAPNRYNLSDDVLAPIIASGDKTAPQKLLNILDEQRKKYRADGRELPVEEINAIIESAVVQQPSAKPIDFDAIEDYIGRPLDDLYKRVLEQSSVTAGGVTFEEPGYLAKPDITSIGPTIKTIAMTQKDGATSEVTLIKRALGSLVDEQGNPREGITDAQRNQAMLLTQRLQTVESALKNFNDDPIGLLNLYGNSYALKLMSQYPEYDGLLPESLTDPNRQYMAVTSRSMAKALLQAGIIEEGTLVRFPDGTSGPVYLNRPE